MIWVKLSSTAGAADRQTEPAANQAFKLQPAAIQHRREQQQNLNVL